MVMFGGPLVLASLATWVFTGVDRIVVAAQLSQQELGGYGLAATLIAPFTVFTLALGQAWIPRIYSLYAKSAREAKASVAAGIEWAQAGLGAAAAGVAFLAPWIIEVVGGDGFEAGASALPFLALGSAYAGTALFTGTGLTLMKRTVVIPLVTLMAAAVDVALLLILVPRLALVGAGIAVASAYFALALGMLVLANRAFPLDPPLLRLAWVSGALWTQAAVSTAYPGTPGAALGLALCLTVVALSIWAGQRGSDMGRAATTK
jgi:O-antigen/teichoic acid export membrane protein